MSYFISKDENSSEQELKRKRYDILACDKMMYWYKMYVGYVVKPTSEKKKLKIRTLLLSKFFYFESGP